MSIVEIKYEVKGKCRYCVNPAEFKLTSFGNEEYFICGHHMRQFGSIMLKDIEVLDEYANTKSSFKIDKGHCKHCNDLPDYEIEDYCERCKPIVEAFNL